MSDVHLVESVVKVRDSQSGDWRADMKLGLGRESIAERKVNARITITA